MDKKIIIYTSRKCFYCLELKRYLLDMNLDFFEKEIEEERYLEEFKKLYEVTQTDALPTLFVGEHLLVPGKSFQKIKEIPEIIKKLISEK